MAEKNFGGKNLLSNFGVPKNGLIFVLKLRINNLLNTCEAVILPAFPVIYFFLLSKKCIRQNLLRLIGWLGYDLKIFIEKHIFILYNYMTE